jgi:hypothetical protein
MSSSVSSVSSVTTAKPPDYSFMDKLPNMSKAQMIAAIEARMTEEERGAYLDSRDMGEEDFYNAEL